MNSETPLPQLHQAELDEATLRQLFADVGNHTELLEILIKHQAAGHVDDTAAQPGLAEALDLLLVRHIRSLQLRYRHDGAVWWDTLTPTPQGTCRIVRIRHDFAES